MNIPIVIFDSSALLAMEITSGLDAVLAGLVADARMGRARIAIPAPVVAEVWRGTPRQAPIARFLSIPGVTVEFTDVARARKAGENLRGVQKMNRGKTRPGAIDALVVESAQRLSAAAIVTGDSTDLTALQPLCRIIAI